MTMTTSKISHIIFDLDGLLLDTERIYTQVSTELLKQYDKEYSFELKAKLMGKGPKEVAAAFIKHYELERKVTEEEWVKNSKEKAEGLLGKCQLMPGAANLVYHFYKHLLPMSIATGSTPQQYDLKISNHAKLFSPATFAHVTNSADVSKTKPDPEMFIKSRDKFNPRPQSSSNCLVFEDAPNGVAAAVAAEMPVVMVPGSWIPDEMTKNANLVLKDLRDFKPELFGLPPFEYRPVKKVIFDFDGTLAETGSYYSMASIAALGALGVTKEQLKQWSQAEYAAFSVKLGGRTPDVVIPAVIKRFGLNVTNEEFEKIFDDTLLPLLRSCKLLPGAEKLINHFHSTGVPMAVATNTTQHRYAASISQYQDIFSKLSHVVAFEDLEGRRGKPAPDIFLAAAQKFQDEEEIKPEDCLVFEDTLVGAAAAQAAGMQCVMVKVWEVEELSKVGVKQVLSGLEEFRPENFGLPPFKAE